MLRDISVFNGFHIKFYKNLKKNIGTENILLLFEEERIKKKKYIYTLSHTHTQNQDEQKAQSAKWQWKNKNNYSSSCRVIFFSSLFSKHKMWMFYEFSIRTAKEDKKIKINGAAICQHTLCIKYLKRDGKMGKNALCWRWSD